MSDEGRRSSTYVIYCMKLSVTSTAESAYCIAGYYYYAIRHVVTSSTIVGGIGNCRACCPKILIMVSGVEVFILMRSHVFKTFDSMQESIRVCYRIGSVAQAIRILVVGAFYCG